ncbi:MAG: iron-containing alcohol dehydrogenase [Streptosporangiaceae bacterium]
MTVGEQTDPGELDLAALKRALADADGLQPIGLGQFIEGNGVLHQLPEVVGRHQRGAQIAVLAAATPILAAGQDLRHTIETALSERHNVQWCVIGSGPDVHADEETVSTAAAAVSRAGCVITVGSGTVTDIGKAAAHAAAGATGAIPLVCVQTATSVNGFADPFSVLLRDGVKRTTPSRWPDVLIADTDVLASAPPDLNRAGVGDMMAMFTASADWYLASFLGHAAEVPGSDPGWNPAVANLTRSRAAELMTVASRFGTLASLAALARILTISGMAMGVAGSTAPASGMEHAISHLLEMAATARGDHGAFHGTQVGVASVVAAQTWSHVRRRIAGGALRRPARLPDPDRARHQIEDAFARLDPTGAMAAECFADYGRKLRRLVAGGDPLAQLRAAWPQFEDKLDALLVDAADIAAALRSAGLPLSFGQLAGGVNEATARWAVASAALQRQRVSVADLAMLLGAWQDDDIDDVLAGSANLAGLP